MSIDPSLPTIIPPAVRKRGTLTEAFYFKTGGIIPPGRKRGTTLTEAFYFEPGIIPRPAVSGVLLLRHSTLNQAL
jgi:hypothetical protein